MKYERNQINIQNPVKLQRLYHSLRALELETLKSQTRFVTFGWF